MAKKKTPKDKKHHSGGKFLLGTILGAAAGLIAGRLTSSDGPAQKAKASVPARKVKKSPAKSKSPTKKS